MKNELIIAQYKDRPRRKPAERPTEMLDRIGLQELKDRFFLPPPVRACPYFCGRGVLKVVIPAPQ